jgi:hypothetical protein
VGIGVILGDHSMDATQDWVNADPPGEFWRASTVRTV